METDKNMSKNLETLERGLTLGLSREIRYELSSWLPEQALGGEASERSVSIAADKHAIGEVLNQNISKMTLQKCKVSCLCPLFPG